MKFLNKFRLICYALIIWTNYLQAQPLASCGDLELENGFQGWTARYGKWNENLSNCGINYTSNFSGFINWRHKINYPNEGNVPCFGNNLVPFVPPGFSKSIMLGNWDDGREWERLSATTNVTEENSMIEVNMAVFLEDPSHNICRQPRFRIRVYDANQNIIPCGEFEVFAASSLPGWGTSICSGYKPVRYLPWTKISIDLRSYIGQNVTLEFQTMDCSEGAHFGFALFALRCLKSEISSTHFCPQQNNAITLTAPEGFSGYQWSSGESTRIISIDNPVPGQTYTVTLSPFSVLNGSCEIEMKYTVPPIPALYVPSDTFYCKNSGVLINAHATGNSFSFSWDNGIQGSNIYINEPGNYSVTASDGYCILTDSINVQESALPQIQVNKTDPVCFSGTGQIVISPNDSSSLYNYSWSTGQTGQGQNLFAGQYTVTVTDQKGCSLTISASLNQPDLPILQLESNSIKCPGEKSLLVASGNFINYVWSSNDQNDSLSILIPGTYTVTATDALGCTAVKSVVVNDYPKPQVAITGGDSTLCPYSTTTINVTVTPTNAVAYSWTGINFNGPGGTVGPGIYTVTIIDNNGCTGYDTFETVSILPPTSTISSDLQKICKPEVASLTVSTSQPVSSYNWSIQGQTGSQLIISEGGEYSVTVTDAEGCMDTAYFTIVSFDEKTPKISGVLDICSGQSSTILEVTGESIVGYLWSFGNFSTSEIQVDNGGTYTVTVTYSYGCSSTNAVTVNEHVPPQPFIQAPAFICQYATGLIATSQNYSSYSWSSGSSSETIDVPAGSYTVTVTDEFGCTGSKEILIAEVPLYKYSLSGPENICRGDTATLNLDLTPSGPLGQAWLSSSSGQILQAELLQGHTSWALSPILTETFSIDSLKIPGYDCPFTSLSDSVIVQVDNIFVVLESKLLANNGPLLCEGDSNAEIYTVVQGGISPFSYVWSHSTSDSANLTNLSSGIYSVTVIGSNGCSNEAEIIITDPAPLNVVIDAVPNACAGINNGLIELQKVSGQGQIAFEINGDDPVAVPGVMNNLEPGAYNIHVFDDFCYWDTVILFPKPPQYFIDLVDSFPVVEMPGPYYFKTITNAPIKSISYSPGWIMDDSTMLRPVAKPTRTTTVKLVATTIEGCILTDQLELSVFNSLKVFVPNVFASGDDQNSIFYISALEGAVRKLSMNIFDRWGNLVFKNSDFQPNDPGQGWNGMVQGKYVNEGVYVCQLHIQYVDDTEEERNSDLTFLRSQY